MFTTTMKSAIEAGQSGRIEQWVHDYLCTDGRNRAFSDGLRLEPRSFHGPVDFPLDLLSRCCGPEAGMKYPVPAPGFEVRVGAIQETLAAGFDLPPLIVNHSGGTLELNDGNHRLEALRRSGISRFNIIVWTTGKADMEDFHSRLGQHCRHPRHG